jgi:hypothetical protein
MGAAGSVNQLYWKNDIDQDFERWQVDLDVPGSFPNFEFRLVYRHGTGGGVPAEFSFANRLSRL